MQLHISNYTINVNKYLLAAPCDYTYATSSWIKVVAVNVSMLYLTNMNKPLRAWQLGILTVVVYIASTIIHPRDTNGTYVPSNSFASWFGDGLVVLALAMFIATIVMFSKERKDKKKK